MVQFGGVIKISRRARQYSQSGLYHIVFRGMNRHNIFEEDEDFIKFKDIVKDLKQEMQFKIYAFCLMSNHVHILLNEYNTGDISAIMKKLLVRYAGWFNRKYSRSGVLIGNRFKSQPVEKDEYLLSLVRPQVSTKCPKPGRVFCRALNSTEDTFVYRLWTESQKYLLQ